MPSEGSSELDSLQREDTSNVRFSKTVPQSPTRADQQPVFFTVPDSPREKPALSDEYLLDIEELTRRLQRHKIEVDRAVLAYEQRKAAKHSPKLELTPIHFSRPLNRASSRKAQPQAAPPIPEKDSPAFSTMPSTEVGRDDIFGSLQQRSSTRNLRSRRPTPLKLVDDQHVAPQEVQSAALPTPSRPSPDASSLKKDWRRMTVSAGKTSRSTIVLMTAPGQMSEVDFTIPPVPVPSIVPHDTLPSTIDNAESESEDQARRELEAFVLEEGSNVLLSRRPSAKTRRRLNGPYAPEASDKLMPPRIHPLPNSPLRQTFDKSAVELPLEDKSSRKKNFLYRFERSVKVDDVLDMYMTPQQLDQEMTLKRKSSMPMKQALMRMWSTTNRDNERHAMPG